MNLYHPNYHYVDNVILESLIYEKPLNSPNVVLFAYYPDLNGQHLLVEYLCDFDVLTDILLAGGEASESLLEVFSDQIKSSSHERINMLIRDSNGIPISLNHIQLKVYRQMEKKHNGEWVECFTRDPFFIIEKALSNFEGGEEKEYHEDMITKYRKYLKAIDAGYTVIQAKAQVGFTYELVFRLARDIYCKAFPECNN